MTQQTLVYLGDELANYHFGHHHPFGAKRQAAFYDEFIKRALHKQVRIGSPVLATDNDIALFHQLDYIEQVRQQSACGQGYLDSGDTPAMPGIFEAASFVVGSTLDATQRIMAGEYRKAFIPIAGLHHATRRNAAGFCVFNDCGVVIEALRKNYQLSSIAYVDIDAHHGDGVFYAFESDADVIFADLHQDGRSLYPGTGAANEIGHGAGQGKKLNIPLPPDATDQQMFEQWPQVETLLKTHQPEFIILQCGADSLDGDPITSMKYSAQAHRYASQRLSQLANQLGHGRLLALGGGGYNLTNIAMAWNAVVEALIENP